MTANQPRFQKVSNGSPHVCQFAFNFLTAEDLRVSPFYLSFLSIALGHIVLSSVESTVFHQAFLGLTL